MNTKDTFRKLTVSLKNITTKLVFPNTIDHDLKLNKQEY